MSEKEQLIKIIEDTISRRTLKKAVLSKPNSKDIKKAEFRLFEKNGEVFVQKETFTSDNKALHQNIPENEAAGIIAGTILGEFRQADIIDADGVCEVLVRKDQSAYIKNKIKPKTVSSALPHDTDKNYILSGDGANCFLYKLGVCDENGRVFDKKRPKFRQINRFLEILDDVYPSLPAGKICVCDLCCGKSYLTFAVYYYLRFIKEREVEMYGVDLKADVIEYCSQTASSLGFDTLHFYCMDITKFEAPSHPQLVVSLHACDIATDLVLAFAAKNKAEVILSTPCCHHEMMHEKLSGEFEFITKNSILKQKFCDAATDALRAKRLEAEGYDVIAMELIDPEETPKNVMIRAIRSDKKEEEKQKALLEYEKCAEFLGCDLALGRLLK